jgi:hypothetical protein
MSEFFSSPLSYSEKRTVMGKPKAQSVAKEILNPDSIVNANLYRLRRLHTENINAFSPSSAIPTQLGIQAL